MFFRIFLVISLIAIGSAAPPAHPQNKANQATYSQSFVREDVPLSYQYSAVHHYNPKKHVVPEPLNSPGNNYESHRIGAKDIQYAAVPQNPNEYIYSTERLIYTSVTPTPSPIIDYEQYEGPEIYDKSALPKHNLEPKQVPIAPKDIKPSTYKPHVNHHVKMYNFPKFTTDPPTYYTLNTQAPSAKPRTMEDILHRLNVYHQLQYLTKGPKNIVPVTTESIKYTDVQPAVTFIPQHNVPLVTLPHKYNGYSSLQPIPRVAYHSNNNVININGIPEKSGRIQMYSRLNNYVHLNNPKPKETYGQQWINNIC